MPQIQKQKSTKITRIKPAQAEKYCSDPKFRARLAKIKSIPVFTSYDIPFISASSESGNWIYIDKSINRKYHELIKLYQVAEKALMDLFKLPYHEAHLIALNLEQKLAKNLGINWGKYTNDLDLINKDINQITNVPSDIDFIPYGGSLKEIPKQKRSIKEMLNETHLNLQYHGTLNPKLWKDDKLDPLVRVRLIQIAFMWVDYANIPRSLVRDIILTGGNANYNYTPKSDLDVHVIINRSELGISKDFVDKYVKDKKELWTINHSISIKGYPVELYAQDISEKYIENQGVYSLIKNDWIKSPKYLDIDFSKDKLLKQKILSTIHIIDRMIKEKVDPQTIKDFKLKLTSGRKSSVSSGGEYTQENLIFKELRNRGYFQKIDKYVKKLENEQLSLQ